jgi:hypothetical protein
MTRLVSIIVALTLLAGAVAPAVAAAHPDTGMPMEICPMMDHTPQDEPCIGQPCPCHGSGGDATTLPDGTRLALPESQPSALTSAPSSCLPPAATPACDAGHRSRIDRPPSAAA